MERDQADPRGTVERVDGEPVGQEPLDLGGRVAPVHERQLRPLVDQKRVGNGIGGLEREVDVELGGTDIEERNPGHS
ncbi:MAG: hypothetical protein KY391_08230 [Actinobacteria bacterium]|nr:hypothetical protein [Actinomycetota bacterium]